MLQLAEVNRPTGDAGAEGYPSGLRGWFAKSLVWGNLEREFESLLLRQVKYAILFMDRVFYFSLSGTFVLMLY
jgi:hypothetical protein